MARLLALAAAVLFVALLLWRPALLPPPPAPVIAPEPMPAWAILPPGNRKVVAAGTYPPQPPYGAAATITYLLQETGEQFVAAYRAQLAAAGYAIRRVTPRDLFQVPDLQLEADEQGAGPTGGAGGGHVIYITLRHTWAGSFAQLTFWAPPAPRML